MAPPTTKFRPEEEKNSHLFFLEARNRNGTGDDNDQPKIHHKQDKVVLPKWVNVDKIRAGQEFVRAHFFSVFFAHLISLIFLLAYTPVRLVLMRTGKSESSLKSLRRYLSTLLHIKRWYEQDILKPHHYGHGGGAAEDIAKIRKVHSQVAASIIKNRMKRNQHADDVMQRQELMRVKVTEDNHVDSNQDATKLIRALLQDFSPLSNCCSADIHNNNDGYGDDGPLSTQIGARSESVNGNWKRSHVISQLDMTVTQFCFMGFISLYPSHFGIHKSNDDKGLDGFIHLWALIGHLLGMEDEFNLCLPNNFGQIPRVLNQILIPELQNCQPATIVLWKALTDGISQFVPCISLPALLVFVQKILQSPILPHDSIFVDELDNYCNCEKISYSSSSSSSSLYSLLSFYDVLCYRLMSWCFSSWLHYQPLRQLFNFLLRLAVYLSSSKFLLKNQSLNLSSGHNNFSSTARTTLITSEARSI